MGERGPAPKRSSQRRRRNKESKPQTVEVRGGQVDVPPAKKTWSPVARQWYESLPESGQTQFFEPSDWWAAYFVAENMSRLLKQQKPSANLFAGIWAAMNDLLSTEASRRRVKLELERKAPEEKSESTDNVVRLNERRRTVAAG